MLFILPGITIQRHKDHMVSQFNSISKVYFLKSSQLNTPLQKLFKSYVSADSLTYNVWLDDRGSRVRFPAGAENFSFHLRVQNGSGDHPASSPMGTSSSLAGSKAAGA